jgi:diguanylate cyclase (GGDEF)-like protein
VRILLVGGDTGIADQLRALLAESRAIAFELLHQPELDEDSELPEVELALVHLASASPGDALVQARSALPRSPLVVIGEDPDEASALRALREGASGYLLRSELRPHSLVTTLAAALENQRTVLQLSIAREHARHLATHDQLTGLANRALFHERLTQAMSDARHNRQRVAALIVNLDGFKAINEALGSAVGDGLLRGIARRLSSCLRDCDTAARMGGDEFGVLLTQLSDERDAEGVAEKLLAALGEPIHFHKRSSSIRCSVGIAVFPRDSVDAEGLIRKADNAMNRAKERGGNRFEFFTPDMSAAIQRRSALEKRLRAALEEDQLRVFYQPQFDLPRARIIGAEALLRWDHPELGIVTPEHFLPIAEESGLIVPIGDWILRAACHQNAHWNREGQRGLRVSVNVSSQQFLEPGFADVVRSALEESELAPVSLELEITESSLLQDVEVTVNTLARLRKLGVRLAIDDFGTGYSALAYLKRLPIDVLKIDRSFINALTTDPADATITETIVKLASGLNLTTIAEGVETVDQLLLLGSYGCTRMQGYLFGRPVPAELFEQWLSDPPFQWSGEERVAAGS